MIFSMPDTFGHDTSIMTNNFAKVFIRLKQVVIFPLDKLNGIQITIKCFVNNQVHIVIHVK